MKHENQTRYAVLGLLTTGCQTGYSIKQMIDKSLNHFWKISYGQIYPILKQLVEEEYASVHVTNQERKPMKKEYNITDKGKRELESWVRQPLKDLSVENNELLLKIFFSRHQDLDILIDLLNQQQEMLTERYNTYVEIKDMITSNFSNDQDSIYWEMTVEYGLLTSKAAIDWCKNMKSRLLDI